MVSVGESKIGIFFREYHTNPIADDLHRLKYLKSLIKFDLENIFSLQK
jgi:hypothetical protein